ncbi:MAG: hypothetical protein H5T64_04950 [Chloroflexi bacterium]|nr:hypothetical protein [Chloroflexota bacterium]
MQNVHLLVGIISQEGEPVNGAGCLWRACAGVTTLCSSAVALRVALATAADVEVRGSTTAAERWVRWRGLTTPYVLLQ